MTSGGKVLCVSIAGRKGEKKHPVPSAKLCENIGLVDDAHAGTERQVSLLPYESFAKLSGPGIRLSPGDFAENITTEGIDFATAHIGEHLHIGASVELEITQIGKECHEGCHVREAVGDCIMPREGIFARVVRGGTVYPGDSIVWLRS